MSSEETNSVPVAELKRERERRQAAEEKFAKLQSEVGEYKSKLGEYEKQINSYQQLQSNYEQLDGKYNSLLEESQSLSTKMQRELALSDMGVKDADAREFALYKFGKLEGDHDFGEWLGAQQEQGVSWLSVNAPTPAPAPAEQEVKPRSMFADEPADKQPKVPGDSLSSLRGIKNISDRVARYKENRTQILAEAGIKVE